MSGIERIAAERRRQIEEEGFTPKHDDVHRSEDLINAAVAYVMGNSDAWPWYSESFKPTTRERDLEKAGALIAAALDRLEADEIACAWSDYRKDYGLVMTDTDLMDAQHKAFIAGWKAARDGDQSGVQR